MTIVPYYATNNPCYSNPSTIVPYGIVLHSIGTPQPSATRIIDSWNRASAESCAHSVVDGNNGNTYQALPWTYRGWHCGVGRNGTANANYIGVEMGESSTIRYAPNSGTIVSGDLTDIIRVADITYAGAVDLFAYLFETLVLDPNGTNTIIGHNEAYQLGISSNHVDPVHLWNYVASQTGQPYYTMDTFRAAVRQKCIDNGYIYPGPTPPQPTPDPSPYWRVQVGAYLIKKNAEKMKIKLNEEGFPAYITRY